MFLLDRDSNRVTKVTPRTFSDLKFSERNHLQEWIAETPSVLGDDLLIIQKEFDGWEETRERLDLLALDKQGNVVVIENKLDDSGRDVVWQALKYAAYCSTLTKQNVLDIYRRYLGNESDQAENKLADFLDAEDFATAELNAGTGQKVILTAARFRPEVTATCLWLIDHDIDIRCIRATPFEVDGKILLNFEQVIPPREAQEFMVRIGQKKVAEQNERGSTAVRHNIRREFYEQLLPNLEGPAAEVYRTRSAGTDHWVSGATGISGVGHNFHFLKNKLRYELSLQMRDPALNKALFDLLLDDREGIEADFGAPLNWFRLDDKITSKINYETDFDSYDSDNWIEANAWLNDAMNRGIRAFQARLDKAMRKGAFRDLG